MTPATLIRNLLPAVVLATAVLGAPAQIVLDWDKIEHWSGSGTNRAAFVVQFNDGEALTAYVWGYRWNGADNPSSMQVIDALIADGAPLYYLVQQTGHKGDASLRLGGIGLAAGDRLLGSLHFDFDAATADSRIGYNYYATDRDGNLVGPGDSTPALCAAAIEAAAATHRIVHPVDVNNFPAAAYDYDYWQVPAVDARCHWNSGWIFGNWVAWTGNENFSAMSYSGMGFATHRLGDGEVIVWNYNRHTSYPSDRDNIDGYTGASRPTRPLDYTLADFDNLQNCIVMPVPDAGDEVYYDLRGRRVLPPLAPGVLIRIQGNKKLKILIK